ncbi:MAG: fibronectin type III domain-containing protein [bacterium]
MPKKTLLLAIFFLMLGVFPFISNAATVFTDDFTGTTINTSKWQEYDSGTGGSGGTAGKIQQNNHLTATGDAINWSTNGIRSQTAFNRNTILSLQADFSLSGSTGLVIPIGIGNNFNISDAAADNLYIKADMTANKFVIVRGGINGTAPNSKSPTFAIVPSDKYRVIINVSTTSGATFKLYDLTVDPTMVTDLLVASSMNVVTGGSFTDGYIFSSARSSTVTTTLYNVTLSATLTAPGTPTSILTSPSNGQESLSWTAPADNGGSAITDYLIEYKLSTEPTIWTTFNDGVSTGTTATVTGLTNGSVYNFRVSTINAIGTGVASSTANGTPNSSVPSAPISLSSSSGLNSSSLLSWTIPLSNGGSAITDYLVEYKLSTEPTVWTTFNDGVSTGTTATVTGLTNGSVYNFRVSAINAVGTSVASNTTTATPSLSVPSAPLSLAASSRENIKSVLTWSIPSSNGGGTISDYLIEYKLSTEPTIWTTFNDGVSTGTTTTVTGLTNDLTYNFRVSATNEAGTGLVSTTASATPGNYILQDDFAGTTINTSKWIETDTGGLGGSTGNIQQNNGLIVTGNNSWNANGLESYQLFDRRKGNIEISTTMKSTSCSLGSTMQFGYGDLNFFGSSDSAYFISKNTTSWVLSYYLNGLSQNGTGTVIPGVSCTDNQPLTMKLVVLQAGGAEIYLGSSLTPAATIAGGTFTNKPIWVQSRASSYFTTYSLLTVKGNISGPDAPQDLTPIVNNEVVNLSWGAPYDNHGVITDYIVEYKLDSEPTIWRTYNDGTSANTSASISGLTTGLLYDFRVSAVNANATGDLSATTTATPLSGTPTAPTVNSLVVLGAHSVGEMVVGNYVYNDVNGNGEASSLYRWLRSDTLGGTYNVISGATNLNYKITNDDLGKYIKFEVTPVTNVAPTTGVATLSSAIGPLTVVNYFNHILLSGQSLSIGYGGTPVLSTTQPYNNKTLAGVTQLGTTFTPLVESNRETIASAMSNNMTALSGGTYQSAVTVHGVGNTAYSGLKKGTVPYANGMTQVTNVFNAAASELSKTDRVVGVAIIHGEADHQQFTTAAEYESYLVEWQHDYETDSKAITGQVDIVPLFTDQMASFTGYNATTSVIPGAQLAAAEDNPGKIVLVGPKYFLNYSDYAHLNNTSYRWLGGYYAKVMKKVLIDKETWRPLTPDSILRSGKVVYAKFHVPIGKIALDTTLVSLRTNYGFEYSDSTSSATISSVEILNTDTVKITLSNVPTGYSQKLGYAHTGTAGSLPGAQEAGSAAGNLRDTDTATSLAGDTLYDWAVNFEKPISLANDSVLPVVTAFDVPLNSGSLTVPINSFIGTDNLSVTGYLVNESSSTPSINDVGWTANAPTIYAFSSGGIKTLYAWTKDAAGNISLSASDSVNVDLIAPSITQFTIPVNSLSLTTNISSLVATDNFMVTGYLVNESSSTPNVNDIGWSGTAPTNYIFSTDGSKTLYAWAKDVVGNISISMSANVSVSLIATAYTFAGPSSGDVNNASTDFTITPNNPYTGIITITPSGSGSSGLSPIIKTFLNSSTTQTFIITPLVSGSITLTPTNSTGITNPSNINFIANAVVPGAVTSVVATSGDTIASVSFIAPVNNGGSEITGYTVTSIPSGGIDTDAGTIKTTHVITNLVNGTHYTFTVRTTNVAGLGAVSNESNEIIPSDTTPPVVTGFSIPVTSGSLTVDITSLSATDKYGIAGYKLTETSSSPLPGSVGWTDTVPANYTFASSGLKTLYAWVKDSSGNVSLSLSTQVTISIISSNYSFSGPTSGYVNNTSTYFTVTPIGSYTGTITITPTGSGSTGLSPIVLTFLNSSNPETFTITPTVIGSIILTPTNGGGLINSSVINYTVSEADVTAPAISIIPSVVYDTSAYAIWTTDDLSSSRVNYGQTNSYGISTEEKDIISKVTNHIVLLSNLNACTTYHYYVYSKNNSGLSGQSVDNTFQTTGCFVSSSSSGSSGGSRSFPPVFSFPQVSITPSVKPVIFSTISANTTKISSPANSLEENTKNYIFTKSLQVGTKGYDVKELQKILFEKGYLKSAPNGVFGPATLSAVKIFQKKHKLIATGNVGPATRALLNK